MTSHTSTSDRRVHDRRFVGVLAGVLALLYLETWLRLSGLLPALAGEAMFGLGLTIAFAATGWFAFTAPPARDDAVRWVENAIEQPSFDGDEEGRSRPRIRPGAAQAHA